MEEVDAVVLKALSNTFQVAIMRNESQRYESERIKAQQLLVSLAQALHEANEPRASMLVYAIAQSNLK